MGEVGRVTVFPCFPPWYRTDCAGGLRDGQGCGEDCSFLFLLQGLVHLPAAFTHFSPTSESLISLLEPDFERHFYSLNPALLFIVRMALV